MPWIARLFLSCIAIGLSISPSLAGGLSRQSANPGRADEDIPFRDVQFKTQTGRVPSGKWLPLGAVNGQGTTVCNTSKNLYACFALRCGKGRGLEFAFLFNTGGYGSFPAANISVDGVGVGQVVFTAIDSRSELVAAFRDGRHEDLLRRLRAGRVMTFDIGFLHRFTLKGSSEEIDRTLQICASAGSGALVAQSGGARTAASETRLRIRIATITREYRQRRNIDEGGFFQSENGEALLKAAMAQAGVVNETTRRKFEFAIASIDTGKLNEQSPFFEDGVKKALAQLSMNAQVEYLAALEAEAVTNYYSQGISTASLAFANSFGLELERLALFDLADDYYDALAAIGARLGQGNGTASGEMLLLASTLVDTGEFQIARGLANRALKRAERDGDAASRVEAHIKLGRIEHALGDFPLASQHARNALKLARQSNVSLESWQKAELDDLVSKAAIAGADTAGVLREYERKLEKSVRDFCGRSDGIFEHTDLSIFDGDRVLAEAASKLTAVDNLIACYRKKTADAKTSKSEFFSTNALREVMFFHATRDARTEAIAYMREVLTPEAFLGNGRRVKFGYQYFAEAIGHAYDGLVLGGHGDWASEPAQSLARHFGAANLDFITYFSDEAVAPALMFLENGQTRTALEFALAFQSSLREFERENPSLGLQPCRSPGICALLATMADRRVIGGGAQRYLAPLPAEFRQYYSGAGTSAGEIRELYNAAIDQAEYYANRNSLKVAAAFLEIANEYADKNALTGNALASMDTLNILTLKARVELASGNQVTARKAAAQIVSAVRRKIDAGAAFGPDVILRWSDKLRLAFDTYLASLDTTSDGRIEPTDDALLATAFLQASGTASTFIKLSQRMSAESGPLVRRHQELGVDLDQAYAQLAMVDGPGARKIIARINKLESDRRKTLSQLGSDSAAYVNLARLHFPTLTELRAALGPGDAMLATYAAETASYIWLITPRNAVFRKVYQPKSELETRIGQYRNAMDTLKGYRPVPLGQGYALFRMLFPNGGTELAGVRRIIAVPNGPFDGLPLAALVTSPPESDILAIDDLRKLQVDWLVRKVSVTVLPSIGAIRLFQSRPSKAARPYLGIGNPDYSNPLRPGGARSIGSDTIDVPALPETAEEIGQIASLFGADKDRDLLLGAAASEQNIKTANLLAYDMISFAAHGVFAGEAEGIDEPALILSVPETPTGSNDGMLTASEVASLRLDADMVILSACNTAAPNGQPGAEGLSGLARSFFFAGARNLAVTHWYIPSDATVSLVTGMAKRKKADQTMRWSDALRRAQVEMIDGAGPDTYAHPGSWAAFFVVGSEQ